MNDLIYNINEKQHWQMFNGNKKQYWIPFVSGVVDVCFSRNSFGPIKSIQLESERSEMRSRYKIIHSSDVLMMGRSIVDNKKTMTKFFWLAVTSVSDDGKTNAIFDLYVRRTFPSFTFSNKRKFKLSSKNSAVTPTFTFMNGGSLCIIFRTRQSALLT